MSEETLLEFPCSFPIKIMGKDSTTLHDAVRAIIKKHVSNINEAEFKTRKSSKGTYVSITVTIVATDKQQLDNIYLDLSACDFVTMSL